MNKFIDSFLKDQEKEMEIAPVHRLGKVVASAVAAGLAAMLAERLYDAFRDRSSSENTEDTE